MGMPTGPTRSNPGTVTFGTVTFGTVTVATFVAVLVMLSACQSRKVDLTGVGLAPDSVSYSADVRPVLDASCGGAACHIPNTTNGVNLSNYASIRASVGFQYGSPIVVPGDADASPMVDKISGQPQFGERMPRGMTPLLAGEIEIIRTWIDEGALDN